ncbi:MAG: hypothetical protein N3A53_08930, partial [Verrucomicrobiae bacterium]|nr:hypothetical protein [Verrucomicrobiae bacterium]
MNASRQLQLNKNSNTPSGPLSSALGIGTTHFVVLKYEWVSGTGNDVVALYLDPTPGGSEPTPAISITSGADQTTLQSVFIAQRSSANPASGTIWIDEIRVGTTWADVTPPLTCTSASITTGPTNQTANVGETVTFHVVATGTSLTNQWELSTDGGSTWSPISGATNASYTTPTLTLADNGNRYRVIVGASCDGITVTSSPPAILTVIDTSTFL